MLFSSVINNITEFYTDEKQIDRLIYPPLVPTSFILFMQNCVDGLSSHHPCPIFCSEQQPKFGSSMELVTLGIGSHWADKS